MKITGNSSHVKFDLENGYAVKADGEMLVGGKFVAFKDSMKNWEPPHENEKLSEKEIQEIIQQVKENTNENTVQISFE
ncbi:hypothetical protein LMxysn_0491 [Listeria monocytogenes]|uniref:Imm74 family immunity protein n=1 Tax=Listeria monocytogenes TaxID=1639 RepID=UPI000A1D3C2C|nr:Imm74 family immunity protein [Listeria monocytogenes]ARM72126.1 hypothetical protein LMxysn_0491 [Listeria monocytogenes]